MKFRARVVASLVATVLAAGCTGDPAPPASGDPDGTSLLIAVAREPADANPIFGYAEHGAAKIFDGLVEHEANLALRPALAADLPEPSADGRSWTVRLRPGVTFSDGTPLEAGDVVATYQALLDPARESPARQRFAMLRSVVAVDAATVRFDLSAPYAAFPELLVLGIVSSESVATAQPVGTGPYRLAKWERGVRMVLEANPSYYDGPPAIKKVTVEIVPDDQTRADRLRDGKVDGAALPPAMAQKFEETDGMQVVSHSTADVRAVVLPAGDPVTGDLDLRLALNHAIDRDALVRDVLAGQGRAAHTPMPGVLAEFVEPTAVFEHDVTKALDMLAASGWLPGGAGVRTRDGVVAAFTLRYQHGDSVSAALAEAFAAGAQAIGVQATVEAADLRDPAVLASGPAVVSFGDPFDPDPGLYPLLHSGTALGGYRDETVDAALDTGRAATDPAQRATAYRKFQRAWVTAPGMVVLTAPNHTYVLRDGWDGYEPVVDAADAGLTWGAWWNLHEWTPQ